MDTVSEWYDFKVALAPDVLEIGCETVKKVTIDVSPKLIEAQRALIMNAEAMRFPAFQFDIVRDMGTLECCDLEKVFKEVGRVLKLGGRFEFTVQRQCWIRRYWASKGTQEKPFKVRQYRLDFVKKVLSEANLTLKKAILKSWGTIYYVIAYK